MYIKPPYKILAGDCSNLLFAIDAPLALPVKVKAFFIYKKNLYPKRNNVLRIGVTKRLRRKTSWLTFQESKTLGEAQEIDV